MRQLQVKMTGRRLQLAPTNRVAGEPRGLYSNIFVDEYRGNQLEDFASVEGNQNLWKQIFLKFSQFFYFFQFYKLKWPINGLFVILQYSTVQISIRMVIQTHLTCVEGYKILWYFITPCWALLISLSSKFQPCCSSNG